MSTRAPTSGRSGSSCKRCSRDGLALAYRTNDRVHLGWLTDAPDLDGEIASIGAGEVGAPAIALDDLVLYAVWAQRARSTEAYRLRWSKWKKHDKEPDAPALLDTGSSSAMAPAIAISNHRIALAWMEEEDGKARVKIGVGSTLEEAAKSGALASPPDVNARDPEIASVGDGFAAIWIEERTPYGEIHVGVVRCP